MEEDPEQGRIPMADEEDETIEEQDAGDKNGERRHSNESSGGPALGVVGEENGPESLNHSEDLTSAEHEEKARLIAQVLELQNT